MSQTAFFTEPTGRTDDSDTLKTLEVDYTPEGASYRMVVDSIVLEGKIYWVRFRRVEGSANSQWLGRSTFARRFKVVV